MPIAILPQDEVWCRDGVGGEMSSKGRPYVGEAIPECDLQVAGV